MAATMKILVVSPDKRREFSGATGASFEAECGSMGVLPHHADILGALKAGCLTIHFDERDDEIFAHCEGFFEVHSGELLLLVDAIESKGEIDVARAEAALKRAEERLKLREDVDFDRARIALFRAINRLRVSGHTRL
ncbi:MAG: ATP synthase delta/epsilon chain alpha-helix domain-containing protein [Candidatus Brocadiia bacterium]